MSQADAAGAHPRSRRWRVWLWGRPRAYRPRSRAVEEALRRYGTPTTLTRTSSRWIDRGRWRNAVWTRRASAPGQSRRPGYRVPLTHVVGVIRWVLWRAPVGTTPRSAPMSRP